MPAAFMAFNHLVIAACVGAASTMHERRDVIFVERAHRYNFALRGHAAPHRQEGRNSDCMVVALHLFPPVYFRAKSA